MKEGRGDREPCWVFAQWGGAWLLGPGRICAGIAWSLVGQLAGDFSTLAGQYGQGEDEVTLRDRVERPLWSSYTAHALPSSVRDKRERRPSVQTFRAEPRLIWRLLMRFSGGLLKIIKKQFL